MEESLRHFVVGIASVHWTLLLGLIVVCLGALGKSADYLVDEAVCLAARSGVPTVIIGATVVSLGTTMPEAAISVFAALQGEPGLALGNAVGSVICDTGLILGLACLIGPLTLERKVVNRQGWIQLAAGLLLAGLAWALGGRLPCGVGFLFLTLLAGYMWLSVHWARKSRTLVDKCGVEGSNAIIALKLAGAITMLIIASRVLIPAVQHAAILAGIPEDIIAATLVAFGTSLPELVTAVTAVRKGEGGLAVGNVVGADILNVFFVAGAACAVTPGGLEVPATFFKLHFPAMIAVLLIFRAGICASGKELKRPFGLVLLGSYAAYLVGQYLFLGKIGG